MAEIDPRKALETLIAERGEDFSSLSRLIGRNAAYVQQYIKRGVPRRLAEEDRRLLARYFDIDEEALGGPPPRPAPGKGLVTVPRLEVGASAGAGALERDETARGRMGFDAHWLRRLGIADPAKLSVIRVEGDSMAPTLADGDEILVDQSDGAERLRDGIYVLRIDDALLVKRLALSPVRGRVAVRSDNDTYPGWPDCEIGSIQILGRVAWVGRKLR